MILKHAQYIYIFVKSAVGGYMAQNFNFEHYMPTQGVLKLPLIPRIYISNQSTPVFENVHQYMQVIDNTFFGFHAVVTIDRALLGFTEMHAAATGQL
uniref:Uncharacterized protein n=1 Tax=Globodera pallida TaxID=36090 RepID=A0A183CMI3_GLOPA